VFACQRANSFDHALTLYYREYGLTGRSSSAAGPILKSLDSIVGDLYFNQCTGALVGVHPLLVDDMSGTDSKPAEGLSAPALIQ